MKQSLLVLCLLLGGCVTPGAVDEPSETTPNDQARPVVIAIIDSGTSPYMPVFATGEGLSPTVPHPFERIDLTGHDRVDADYWHADAAWSTMSVGQLYHFTGTRLFSISFEAAGRPPPNWDASGHGSATSYLAAREAPQAVIVMLQVSTQFCAPDEGCLMPPSFVTAMEWASDQSWIDIISYSLGVPANPPTKDELHADVERFLSASERAASRGVQVLTAAGNDGSPTLLNYLTGTPWTITVGGADVQARGENFLSSKGVDLVSNFTEHVPWNYSGEGAYEFQQGTSLAAPIVAGALANAVQIVRTAASSPEINAGAIRDALNASAIMFQPTDWDPRPPNRQPLPGDLLSPTTPILISPQVGWGYVNGSLAPEIARRVLEQDFSVPSGKEQAALYQPQWQRAREEFWRAWSARAS